MQIDIGDAVARGAAVRRVQTLEPAGGPGAIVFPSTYPEVGHLIYGRRIKGATVQCVRIDSVQSQANRMELALAALIRDEGRKPRVELPLVRVDFGNGQVVDSLTAPHRVFDAILRDSTLDGVRWLESERGWPLTQARPDNARAVFEIAPASLLFGAWYSTGINSRGTDARFERMITSEIDGIGVEVAKRAAVRRDPLNIPADVRIYVPKGSHDWELTPFLGEDERLYEGGEQKKPSGINHSSVIGRTEDRGVTVDRIELRQVITLAGLRKLRFGTAEQDTAARGLLLTLGLVAAAAQDEIGYALRSGCTLIPTGAAEWELIDAYGEVSQLDVTLDAALPAFEAAVAAVRKSELTWNTTPIELIPTPKLRNLASAGGAVASE